MPLSPVEREAERQLAHHYVCLIGHAERVPRTPGDNIGGLGVRVVVTKDPRNAHRVDDQRNAFHPIKTWCAVNAGPKGKAEKLAEELRVALGLHSDEARHTWRNIDADFDMQCLDLLISHAAESCGVDILDELDHVKMRTALARKLMRQGLR